MHQPPPPPLNSVTTAPDSLTVLEGCRRVRSAPVTPLSKLPHGRLLLVPRHAGARALLQLAPIVKFPKYSDHLEKQQVVLARVVTASGGGMWSHPFAFFPAQACTVHDLQWEMAERKAPSELMPLPVFRRPGLMNHVLSAPLVHLRGFQTILHLQSDQQDWSAKNLWAVFHATPFLFSAPHTHVAARAQGRVLLLVEESGCDLSAGAWQNAADGPWIWISA
mmetsp:Transcript_30027/g.60533  ORF Transcript_30027/g.60533 Transcript_30027/m.60533 type:complete len:221 (+) Transcript_30027:473-1135(+)